MNDMIKLLCPSCLYYTLSYAPLLGSAQANLQSTFCAVHHFNFSPCRLSRRVASHSSESTRRGEGRLK